MTFRHLVEAPLALKKAGRFLEAASSVVVETSAEVEEK
jgi:hypothetical protein